MPTSNFPGGAAPQYQIYSWTGNPPVRTNQFTLPQANICANGKRPLTVTQARGYMAGRGASRTVSIEFDGTATSNFTANAGSYAVDTGWKSLSKTYPDQQSAVIRFNSSGDFYFGRAETAGTTYDAVGVTWGGALCGQFQWIEAPGQAGRPSLTINSNDSTAVDIEWAAPDDDGGTSITGYRIEYWRADIPSSVSTADVTGTQTTISGLTAGARYVFRVAAKNSVTTAASTYAAFSSTRYIDVTGTASGPSGTVVMKVWNGSTWST